MVKYDPKKASWLIPLLDDRKYSKSIQGKYTEVVVGDLFLDSEYYRTIQKFLEKL